MTDKQEINISLVQQEISTKSNKITNLKWKDALPQISATLCAYAIVIQAGVNLAFSAILLPQLKDDNSDIRITTEEASWIASLVTISLPCGALSLGYLMDKFGRKKICILTCFPFIISWLLVATSSSVLQLYIARILAGTGGGLSSVSIVYVSEISHPVFRPMLLGLNSVCVSLGILITCALGVWCNWRTVAIINCVMSVLCLLLLIPVPESPLWLITFSKVGEIPTDQISKSLRWIYRNEKIYEDQYNEIIKLRPKQPVISSTNKLFQRFSIYCDSIVYKPFIILVILFIFQQFSGGYVIIFYAVDVFKSIGGNFGAGFDQFTSIIMIGVIRFVMSMISSLLSKRFGRKSLLCSSGIGMAICTLCVSGYMSFCTHLNLDFIPLIFVLGYVTFASFGFFVVPWGLISELFPVKVRATMGGVMITWAYVCMFFIVKMFPMILELFGVSLLFAIYSIVSFTAVLFTIYFIPETFGKTFSEIEDYFKN